MERPKGIGYKFKVTFWVLSYIHHHKYTFILFLLFGLVMTVCTLVMPKIVGKMIDDVLPASHFNLYSILIGFVLIVAVIYTLSSAYTLYYQNKVGALLSRSIQWDIFKKIRELGYEYFERNPLGRIMALLNTEIQRIQEVYQYFIPEVIKYLLMVVISIFYLFSVNIQLTLVLVPGLLLFYITAPFLDRKVTHLVKQSVDISIDFNKKIYDSVSALNILRTFHVSKWDFSLFSKKMNDFIKIELKKFLTIHIRVGLRQLIIYGSLILVFVIGAHMVRGGGMTVGEFVSFMLYSIMAMTAYTYLVSRINATYIRIQHAYILYELKCEEPKVREPFHPVELKEVQGSILFENVSFSYQKDRKIIDRFQLDIEPGEKVAIVGASGSGKSTILKLLCRFYDPDSGMIKLDGIPIDRISLEQLRTSIGYVSQETHILPMSIKDNILFGRLDASDEEVMEAAKQANAHDFIMNLPNGYDELVGEKGHNLSGGQKQRIALARMIVKNPAIVLLDEATSALDSITEELIKNAFKHLFKNKTVISVAHNISTIAQYDKIIYLDNGKVKEAGNYEQLMQKREALYHLLKNS